MYRPLNYFASLYRQVQKNMMNMDKMLAMLEIEPTVKVSPFASPLSPEPAMPCIVHEKKIIINV